MKTLKVFIIGGFVFMLIAVGFGVYVWFQLQQLEGKKAGVPAAHEPLDTEQSAGASDAETSTPTTPTVTSVNERVVQEDAVVIDQTALTPEQKELLEKLGVDTESMAITSAMVECAEVKLGTVRVDEIIAGATPSLMEGLSVLPCLDE